LPSNRQNPATPKTDPLQIFGGFNGERHRPKQIAFHRLALQMTGHVSGGNQKSESLQKS
jgi:hypothetical protein